MDDLAAYFKILDINSVNSLNMKLFQTKEDILGVIRHTCESKIVKLKTGGERFGYGWPQWLQSLLTNRL